MADEPLVMWTVYDHPDDQPDVFIARKWLIGIGPEPVATGEVITSTSLDWIRFKLTRRGLVPLARDPKDDPMIVETWL
jgi:hypothetical protein